MSARRTRVAAPLKACLLAWSLLGAVGSRALASGPYAEPSAGNQYVSNTDKYLYVVWSVPKDLAPFAHIHDQNTLESYVARTAIHLCIQHRARAEGASKPCKLQLVRMNSNDEYTKSAAAGFKTVAKLVLPLERASDAVLAQALKLDLPQLKALFTSFEIKHDRIPLTKAP